MRRLARIVVAAAAFTACGEFAGTESGNPSTVAEPELFAPASDVETRHEPDPPPPALPVAGSGSNEPPPPTHEPPVPPERLPDTLDESMPPTTSQTAHVPVQPGPSDVAIEPPPPPPPRPSAGGLQVDPELPVQPPELIEEPNLAPIAAGAPSVNQPVSPRCQPQDCEAAAQDAAESLATTHSTAEGHLSGGGVCAQPGVCVCGGGDAGTGVELPLQPSRCLVENRLGQCVLESTELQPCQPGAGDVCSQHCDLVDNARLESTQAIRVSVSAAECGISGCRYVLRGELCAVGGEATALSAADCSLSDAALLSP